MTRDKFLVKCPICDSESTLIRNPGVSFYVSKGGCNHRKELFAMVRKYHRAQRVAIMLRNRYKDLEDITAAIHTLRKEFEGITNELSGKLFGPTELYVGEWRKAKG